MLHDPPARLDTDVLVIGTGPGGATVAALAAEHGRGVLAIDEGPYLPLESCVPFSQDEMTQKYRHGGVSVALGTTIAYAEGRCVGGGSEVNSALHHRLPAEELSVWRRIYGLDAATEADLAPHAAQAEAELGIMAPAEVLPGASAKLQAGARALGWRSLEVPRFADPPVRTSEGLSPGVRHAMTRTFLPRALAAGARLLPATSARRLHREAGAWRIVAEHRPAGRPPSAVEIRARHVSLCAGAIHTPALLRRSGITHNVGSALRLQTMVRVVARFPERVNTRDMDVAAHQVRQFAPRYSFGCSISTPPFLAMAMLDHGEPLAAVADAWEHLAIFYVMVRGGIGSVRNLPAFRDPLVRYRLARRDLADLGDGMRDLGRLLFAAGAEALYPGVSGVGVLERAEQLGRIPGALPASRTTLLSLHLLGSCPMGERRERSAVDSFGRVHDAPGLRVADASMLCAAPGVNPQGGIMTFARRNALHMLGRL